MQILISFTKRADEKSIVKRLWEKAYLIIAAKIQAII